jgi:hypothetical protein
MILNYFFKNLFSPPIYTFKKDHINIQNFVNFSNFNFVFDSLHKIDLLKRFYIEKLYLRIMQIFKISYILLY